MAKPLIPLRPSSDKFDLTVEEKQGLTYLVISGCPRDEAFLRFVRPDFIGGKAPTALKAAVSQFYASKEVQDYIEAYRQTLEKFLGPKETKMTPAKALSLDERKGIARTKLTEFAMQLIEDIDSDTQDENAPDVESILKIADKVGLLDSNEKAEEEPRRYLPETCSDCEYRKFCEENCEEIDDNNQNSEEYEL